MVEKIGDGII